jgi:hypothetical protein
MNGYYLYKRVFDPIDLVLGASMCNNVASMSLFEGTKEVLVEFGRYSGWESTRNATGSYWTGHSDPVSQGPT